MKSGMKEKTHNNWKSLESGIHQTCWF